MKVFSSAIVDPAGILYTEPEMIPDGHIYLNERADWDRDLEKVPHYEELPEE